ncbi:MAG: efflux RND transporter periplasmic adaptor subunit [Propionivibrio sp.]|nr:efflux RND transporter periplasmic adaptor subunit [Propionivibrio sp.]
MNFFPIALILAGTYVLAACSDSASEKKLAAPPVPVTAAQATERDIPVSLQVVGRAEAFASVILKSRVDGQVAEVFFTEGQHVKRGDLLIRLDPADFSARLRQAQAAVARDESLAAKTRSDTARYLALKDRNFVSAEKVNETRTNESAAAANLRASKAAAEMARLQLSYAAIRAPFDGVVGARLVFAGSSVKINDTPLAVVNRVRPLLVSFSVPEKFLPRLKTAPGSVTGNLGDMKVEVSLPQDKSQRFGAKLRFLDNAVDSATGTILMKAELPNDDERLTPGQFLNVTLLLQTLAKAVAVPDEAVQQGATGQFVFVVKNDGRVDVRPVETTASDGNVTAIGNGLHVGETVVTDGQLRLTPGARVIVKKADASDVSDVPDAAKAPDKPANP